MDLELIYKTETDPDLENELMVARSEVKGGVEGWREGTVREFGIDMYTLLYLKQMNNRTCWNTWNSAQCHVAAWTAGGLGGEWTHVYVWLIPSRFTYKLPQHC